MDLSNSLQEGNASHVRRKCAFNHSPESLTRQSSSSETLPSPSTSPTSTLTSNGNTNEDCTTAQSSGDEQSSVHRLSDNWEDGGIQRHPLPDRTHASSTRHVLTQVLIAHNHIGPDLAVYDTAQGSLDKAVDTTMANKSRVMACHWQTCGREFSHLKELADHVNDEHVRIEGPDVDFQCRWQGCQRHGRGFNARYKMLIHIRTHTNEKPHSCGLCNKSFSRLENLKIHTRSHTGERPYTCNFPGCCKAYSNSSDRFKHVRTHQEERPYKCKMPGCRKRYTDPSSLRKHVRTHGHSFDCSGIVSYHSSDSQVLQAQDLKLEGYCANRQSVDTQINLNNALICEFNNCNNSDCVIAQKTRQEYINIEEVRVILDPTGESREFQKRLTNSENYVENVCKTMLSKGRTNNLDRTRHSEELFYNLDSFRSDENRLNNLDRIRGSECKINKLDKFKDGENRLKSLDGNGDGENRFSTLDKFRDGEKRFNCLDRDRDGENRFNSLDKFRDSENRFNSLNRNRDGENRLNGVDKSRECENTFYKLERNRDNEDKFNNTDRIRDALEAQKLIWQKQNVKSEVLKTHKNTEKDVNINPLTHNSNSSGKHSSRGSGKTSAALNPLLDHHKQIMKETINEQENNQDKLFDSDSKVLKYNDNFISDLSLPSESRFSSPTESLTEKLPPRSSNHTVSDCGQTAKLNSISPSLILSAKRLSETSPIEHWKKRKIMNREKELQTLRLSTSLGTQSTLVRRSHSTPAPHNPEPCCQSLTPSSLFHSSHTHTFSTPPFTDINSSVSPSPTPLPSSRSTAISTSDLFTTPLSQRTPQPLHSVSLSSSSIYLPSHTASTSSTPYTDIHSSVSPSHRSSTRTHTSSPTYTPLSQLIPQPSPSVPLPPSSQAGASSLYLSSNYHPPLYPVFPHSYPAVPPSSDTRIQPPFYTSSYPSLTLSACSVLPLSDAYHETPADPHRSFYPTYFLSAGPTFQHSEHPLTAAKELWERVCLSYLPHLRSAEEASSALSPASLGQFSARLGSLYNDLSLDLLPFHQSHVTGFPLHMRVHR